MQTKINRLISVNDRVIPEIQNINGSIPLVPNGTGTRTSIDNLGVSKNWKESNAKFINKVSGDAFDFRENVDLTPYTSVTL